MFYTSPKTNFGLLCLTGRCDIGLLYHCYPIRFIYSFRIFLSDSPTSPPMTTLLVVANVSHATLASGSSEIKASRTASDILSHTLSGCPSDTDSEVKVKLLLLNFFSPDIFSSFRLLNELD